MKKCVLSFVLAIILIFGLIPSTAWAAKADFIVDNNGILTAYNGPGGDVVIPDGVRYVGFDGIFNGVDMDHGGIFAGRDDITSISFPSSVISIGKRAFAGCTGLTSITIPDNVKRTGTEIFSGCTGLTDVTISGSVKRIQTAAFMGCSNLKNVTLCEGIKVIGGDSFRGCTSLTSISIPDSVETIESLAFLDCTNLAEINIPQTTDIQGNPFGETAWLEKQGDWVVLNGTLLSYRGEQTDVVIPDYVTALGGNWYEGGYWHNNDWYGLEYVVIPHSVTEIKGNAFWHCTDLKSVNIPDSVTYIGSRAFADTGLTKVVIPDSVKTVGNAAFEECYNLTDIVIPNSVTEIDPSEGGIPAFDRSPNVIIHGSAGSYAEDYAKEHGISFVADLTPAITVGGFRDVQESDYFAQPVLWAVEKGIAAGTSANSFSPNQVCRKVEILTFLWRSQGKPEPSIRAPYSNLSPDDYYYKAVLWGCETGLVDRGDFDRECTRSFAMMYLWILAGRPSAPASDFTDVPQDAEYAQAVSWAVEQGVTAGTSATTFSPDSVCTRGQIVTFLYRAFGK